MPGAPRGPESQLQAAAAKPPLVINQLCGVSDALSSSDPQERPGGGALSGDRTKQRPFSFFLQTPVIVINNPWCALSHFCK